MLVAGCRDCLSLARVSSGCSLKVSRTRSRGIPLGTLACKPVSVACEPSLWSLLPRAPGNGFRTPETEGPKLPLSGLSSLQRLEVGKTQLRKRPKNRGYSAMSRKHRFAHPRGLKLVPGTQFVDRRAIGLQSLSKMPVLSRD